MHLGRVAKVRLLKAVEGIAALALVLGVGVTMRCDAPIASALRVPTGALTASVRTSKRVTPKEISLPWLFVPDVGEASPEFEYIAVRGDYGIALSKRSVVLSVPPIPSRRVLARPSLRHVRLHLVGANRCPELRGEGLQPSRSNFLIGNDPSRWHRGVANFRAVRYEQVYPGVDWLLYGNGAELEYDFAVAPGADPGRIRLGIDGADRLSVDAEGDLIIQVAHRRVRQIKPRVYQVDADGERRYIDGHYQVRGRKVRVVLGSYDPSRELIIDPKLAFSTYLGGSGSDAAKAIAVDAEGNVYATGNASSTNFPTVDPYQSSNKGDNIFITKMNAAGTGLIYSTYLGGSVTELSAGIAVDSMGNAYVAGFTASPDFPTQNAFQSTYKGRGAGGGNGFITKLDPTGETLVYSTYLGGSVQDSVHGLAIDSAGHAFVAGETSSSDFPISNPLQATLKGRMNAFITELSADGTTLAYSTYLGGSAADGAYGIALDSADNAYIAGPTNSVDFPTVNPFQSSNHVDANGSTNPTGFVAKLSASGNALLFSSYLGGSTGDVVYAIAVDGSGNTYVAGSTSSSDFPTVNAFQNTNKVAARGGGGSTGFVTKIDSSGGALVYSTYIGGSGALGDAEDAIAVDGAGDVFIAGLSNSTDFPTVNAVQSANSGADIGVSNAVVSELNPSGSALLFSTYLGGAGSCGNAAVHTTNCFGDSAAGIAVDDSGNIYVAGQTGSSDFPTLNAYQSTNKTTTQYGSNPTAFVSKFGTEVTIPPTTTPGAGSHGGGGAFGWNFLGALSLTLLAISYGKRTRSP